MDWDFTSIEEGRDGGTANQVLQEQTLSGNEDGNERSQGIMKRQVTDLKKSRRTHTVTRGGGRRPSQCAMPPVYSALTLYGPECGQMSIE